MSYYSIHFFFLIAFGWLVFHALPERWRKAWLLLLSWGWYAQWSPGWAAGFFLIAQLNFFSLRWLPARWLKAQIAANLLLFVVLKSGGWGAWKFVPPYAISFILFMQVGALIDQLRQRERALAPSWCDFMLFSQFFLFLMGGPIEKLEHFLAQLRQRLPALEAVADGGLLMAVGFIKTVLIWPSFTYLSQTWAPASWGGLFAYGFLATFKVYLELSGLCDMGRGAARAFGITATLNFRPFYYATSPNDYWARWNITVGTWIRNYVTFPMMLRWGRQLGPYTLILVASLLMGLWHGLTLPYLAFGFFNGAMIVLFTWSERHRFPRWWGRLLAICLMAGNGLIPLWGRPLPASGPISWPNLWSLGALVVLLALEMVQEWRRDPDWPWRFPLRGKLVVLALFVLFYLYGLDSGLIRQKEIFYLPQYFKM